MPLILMQRPLAPPSGAPGAVRRPSGSAQPSHPPALLSSPFASPQTKRPFSAPALRATALNVTAARSASPLAPLTFIPGTLLHRRSSGGSGGGGRGNRPASAPASATVADAALAPPPPAPTVDASSSLDEETHHQVRRRHVVDEDPPAPQEFLAKYMLGELLGRGASASVRVAVDRSTGHLAAAKLLRRRVGAVNSNKKRDRSAALAAEVSACRRLQSARHAARLLDVFESDESVAIVSELLPGGDLSDLLAHSPTGRLTEREAALAARAALEFVADAHDLGFVVGDVKPQNFALRRLYPSTRHLADPQSHPDKGPLDVAAIDFGCCVDYAALAAARSGGGAVRASVSSPSASPSPSPSASSDEDEVCVVLPSLQSGAAGGSCSSSSSSSPRSSPLPSPSSLSPLISGTPIYMAPEVLKGCASPASDAWACGVMLYELLTGQFPFWREPASDVASLGARAVTEAINHGPVLFPRDPFGASSPAAQGGRGQGLRPSVQDLLLALLQRDPSRRLSARQAAEHPWFSEVLGE